jgi:hypothetical protein
MVKDQFVFYGIKEKIPRIKNSLRKIFRLIFLSKYFFIFINYLQLNFFQKKYIYFSMNLKIDFLIQVIKILWIFLI